MSFQPFTPQGGTVVISANVAAPVPSQVAGSNGIGCVTYRIANTGNETIWYTFQANANAAAARCTLPTANAPYFTLPLPAGAVTIERGPANAWFCGITRGVGNVAANLEVTPGDGI